LMKDTPREVEERFREMLMARTGAGLPAANLRPEPNGSS